jgi:hypothetical protein
VFPPPKQAEKTPYSLVKTLTTIFNVINLKKNIFFIFPISKFVKLPIRISNKRHFPAILSPIFRAIQPIVSDELDQGRPYKSHIAKRQRLASTCFFSTLQAILTLYAHKRLIMPSPSLFTLYSSNRPCKLQPKSLTFPGPPCKFFPTNDTLEKGERNRVTTFSLSGFIVGYFSFQ